MKGLVLAFALFVVYGKKYHGCLKRESKPIEFLLSEDNRPENKYKGI